MLKIQYPKNRQRLHDDYLDLFKVDEMQSALNVVLANPRYQDISPIEIKTLLVGSIEEIVQIVFSFDWQNIPEADKLELKKIFKYDLSFTGSLKEKDKKGIGSAYQPAISAFFTAHRDDIKLCTCYFCNLDYVSSFSIFDEYVNAIDFLMHATDTELGKIEGIGNKTIEYIHQCRLTGINTIEALHFPRSDEAIKTVLRRWDIKFYKSQFTLDHLISKALYPFVGLSLYNLVPSCYACNSVFKGIQPIIERLQDAFLSPTSEHFDFPDKVKFEIYTRNDNLNLDSIDDFEVKLTANVTSEIYAKYSRIFKLVTRYNSHKQDALNLMLKHRAYRPDKLRQMADLLSVDIDQLKQHIFGDELYIEEDCELPKAKFKKDIAQNIGLFC